MLFALAVHAQEPRGWGAVTAASSLNARNQALADAHRTAATEPGGMERLLKAEDALLAGRGADPAVQWWRGEALLLMRQLTRAASSNRALLAADPTAPALNAQEGDIALRDFDTRAALAAWTRAGETRSAAATGLAAHRASLEAVRMRQWLWLAGATLLAAGVAALLWKRFVTMTPAALSEP